jgi:hypothetical protein
VVAITDWATMPVASTATAFVKVPPTSTPTRTAGDAVTD